MNIKVILGFIIGIPTGLGLFAFGAGYLWSQIKKGNKQGKDESNELIKSNDDIKAIYKEQNSDLKEINKVLGEKIEALTREVGEIRGQLNSEKAQNERLEKIFQGRDPENQKFMEYMINATKTHDEFHKELMRIVGEIHTFAEQEHQRDFKITTTTNVTKDGDK